MTVSEVSADYTRRFDQLNAEWVTSTTRTRLTLAATFVALVVAWFVVRSSQRDAHRYFVALAPAAVSALCLRQWTAERARRNEVWRLIVYYEAAQARMSGDYPPSQVSLDEFTQTTHAYAADLDIFAAGALFDRLCTTRTCVGRRTLAAFLLDPPSVEETRARQAAVAELAPQVELRERLATMGRFDSSATQWRRFDEWLNAEQCTAPMLVRVLAALSAACVFAPLLALFVTGLDWHTALGISAVPLTLQGLYALPLRRRVRERLRWLHGASSEIRLIREGVAALDSASFHAPKLRALQQSAHGATHELRRLERLLSALEQRNKEWFYGAFLALMLSTQLCWALEAWRERHGAALRLWLQAWGEFESLNALALDAYEHPDYRFPTLLDNAALVHATSLAHPLLLTPECVANDIEIDAESRFYVISGSNMSGKSTLLRAIGLNVVLARAGAMVRAASMELGPLLVCASLSVVDSLRAGQSKFAAEMERLRCALDSSNSNAPVLFLIDEILAGTNSRDRRIAVEAVVRTLIERGAIGVISTHDLALTEIAAAAELRGRNVHMGSGNAASPLAFDYKLKPGVTRESNALAIARMAGVPV